jgi:hypothetical protein
VRNLTLRTPTLDDVFLELTGTHIQTSDEAMEAELAEMTEMNESDTTEVRS